MTAMMERELREQMEYLPLDQQQKVVDFARALAMTRTPRGVPGRELMHLAGTLPDEDAAEMLQAIEEGCEQIDYDGWDLPARH